MEVFFERNPINSWNFYSSYRDRNIPISKPVKQTRACARASVAPASFCVMALARHS